MTITPTGASANADPPGLDRYPQGRAGWTPGRIVALVLGMAMLTFWVWALSPWVPSGHPDALDDDTFATAAEPLCAAAVDQVEATVLPAIDATDMGDRADQIETATDIFTNLVNQLRVIAPDPATDDGELVALWLDDWEVFLGDRYAQADKFRAGIDEAFVVTAREGDQITAPIDLFADINDMESCVSPTDV